MPLQPQPRIRLAPTKWVDLIARDEPSAWVALREHLIVDRGGEKTRQLLEDCKTSSAPGASRLWPAAIAELRKRPRTPDRPPTLFAIPGKGQDVGSAPLATPNLREIAPPVNRPWRNNSAEDLAKIGLTRTLAPLPNYGDQSSMLRTHGFMTVTIGELHNFVGFATYAKRLEERQSFEAVLAAFDDFENMFPRVADEPLLFGMIKQLGEPNPANPFELDRLDLGPWPTWAAVEAECLRYAVEFLLRLEA